MPRLPAWMAQRIMILAQGAWLMPAAGHVDPSPAQVQPHAEHRATRIDEGGAEAEVGAG